MRLCSDCLCIAALYRPCCLEATPRVAGSADSDQTASVFAGARTGRCPALEVDMNADLHLIEFWAIGGKRCVLFSVDHVLEVRLYERNELVALEPCESAGDALDIARAWRQSPPRWPPY
jgi:hypothetical protein